MHEIIKAALVLIIVFRVGLFLLPSFQIDMNTWKAWAFKLGQSGPATFYSQDYFSDYFPGYLYILWISGTLFNFLSIPINSLPFEFLLKSVTLLFDIASAFVIYKIILRHHKQSLRSYDLKQSLRSKDLKKWAYFAPILYLANPAIFFNSSVWGQVDGIFTFFLLTSAFFLFEQKKIFKSTISTTLGILVKPHSLALIPILFLYTIKNFSKEKIVKSITLGFLALVFLSLPFFPKNPIFGLIELADKSQGVYQYTSAFAFNFWGFIGSWKPDSQVFVLSFRTWGIVLYICSLILIILPMLRRKINEKQLYFATSLSLFSFFLFLTRMHERYLFPFFAFLLIAAIIKKSKTLFSIYIISSLLHFTNLLFVYYYYNFVYIDSNFTDNFFYLFVNNNFKYLSILMLILFSILLFFHYRDYVKKD